MSTAVLIPAGDFDDDSDAEFWSIVEFRPDPEPAPVPEPEPESDSPRRPVLRPSRAAERREGREQIERGLGINRHRKSDREV
jgi:hypothetical protein